VHQLEPPTNSSKIKNTSIRTQHSVELCRTLRSRSLVPPVYSRVISVTRRFAPLPESTGRRNSTRPAFIPTGLVGSGYQSSPRDSIDAPPHPPIPCLASRILSTTFRDRCARAPHLAIETSQRMAAAPARRRSWRLSPSKLRPECYARASIKRPRCGIRIRSTQHTRPVAHPADA